MSRKKRRSAFKYLLSFSVLIGLVVSIFTLQYSYKPADKSFAQGLSVQITSPNGGETLVKGQQYTITWNASPSIDAVILGYSSGPGSLDNIEGAFMIPNTGSYTWTVFVGNTVNTQFKISITAYDTGVGSVTDQSDSFFTVLNSAPTAGPSATSTTAPTLTQAQGGSSNQSSNNSNSSTNPTSTKTPTVTKKPPVAVKKSTPTPSVTGSEEVEETTETPAAEITPTPKNTTFFAGFTKKFALVVAVILATLLYLYIYFFKPPFIKKIK